MYVLFEIKKITAVVIRYPQESRDILNSKAQPTQTKLTSLDGDALGPLIVATHVPRFDITSYIIFGIRFESTLNEPRLFCQLLISVLSPSSQEPPNDIAILDTPV